MKLISILTISLITALLVGCSSSADVRREIIDVKVPVYQKPKIVKIPRPTLLSDTIDGSSYDVIVKTIKVDFENLKIYSIQLENQLETVVEFE